MKRLVKCLAFGCGLFVFSATGQAQQTIPTTIPAHPLLKPVGTRLPQAVPSAGTRIGMIPGGQSPGLPSPQYNTPQRPPGVPIDLSNVIAPGPGQPEREPTFWETLQARWFSLFQSDEPAMRPGYTPGIARRNQERREARLDRWQRD